MDVPRFGALGDFGHMAAHTIAKGVNRVGQIVINQFMAHETLLRPGAFGLELSRRHTQLMDIVAGGAGNTLLGMLGLLPVIVLLVMPFSKLVWIEVFNVSLCVRGSLIIWTQCPARPVARRPVDAPLLG